MTKNIQNLSSPKYLICVYKKIIEGLKHYLIHICTFIDLETCKFLGPYNKVPINGSNEYGIYFKKPKNIIELSRCYIGDLETDCVSAYFAYPSLCKKIPDLEFVCLTCNGGDKLTYDRCQPQKQETKNKCCNDDIHPIYNIPKSFLENCEEYQDPPEPEQQMTNTCCMPDLNKKIPTDTVETIKIIKIKKILEAYINFYQYVIDKYCTYNNDDYNEIDKCECDSDIKSDICDNIDNIDNSDNSCDSDENNYECNLNNSYSYYCKTCF